MNKRFALLVLAAALLTGCATVTAPRPEIVRIPITKEDSRNLRIESAQIVVADGRHVVTGRVRKLHRFLPSGGTHVDVEFFDAGFQQIALKSAGVHFQRRRIGLPPPAIFSVPAEPWPAGVAAVIVRPHAGATHQPKTS